MQRAIALLKTDYALIALAGAALLTIASAHLFEAAGYFPCELCLRQREAHWMAAAVAAFGFFALRLGGSRATPMLVFAGVALVFLTGAGVAGYHAGVEWKFWEGPQSCSGGADNLSLEGIGETLAQGVRGPSCSEAQWRLFGLSMASYNMLISLGLAATAGYAAWMRRPNSNMISNDA